jgi:hypothetical protein
MAPQSCRYEDIKQVTDLMSSVIAIDWGSFIHVHFTDLKISILMKIVKLFAFAYVLSDLL